ncbi:MAG: large repetitive protein, partial [Gaiellaceae bacterium]|nr:large repetitive protein [Gaiellaceae bacterium]
DNQAPVVAMTVPADTSYVNAASPDPFTVNATATDNGTGVAQVAFSSCTTADCAGGTVASIGTDTTGTAGTYGAAWAVPADGSYWIRAVATDNVGHSSTSINAVTVDRTLPDTTLLTKPGDPTNDANPTFAFSANEATQGYECKLDAAAWASCSSPHSLAVTPADGSHTLQIRAIDLAGNKDASAASWTWNEDTTAPTATLTDPAAGNAAHAIRGTLALASTTADPTTNGYASGVDSATLTYEYSSDGIIWAPIAAPAAWDTTAITDGVYQMQVLITDHAGNVTTSAAVPNVKIDNTQPVTAQDDPGANLHNTITLTGTAADPNDPQGVAGSGVDHVDFQISPAGANSWTTVGTDSTDPYTASYDTHSVTDGHYDFRTVAYDVAGNETQGTPVTNRLIDNTKPTVQLADPGANRHGIVDLSVGLVQDDPGGANASGIVSTAYSISADGGATWTGVPATWNTAGGIPDGLYDIEVVVTDAAGNVSDASVVTGRRIDNTKPVTTASGIPSGFSASDVTVSLSPTDGGSGVVDTIYQVDGGSVQHGTSVVIPAPSNGSNDGSHTVTYQSTDAAGNVEDQKSSTIQIDATPPACPSCSASDYVSGTVTLTATPSDSGAGIDSVEFQYSANGSSGWNTIGTDSSASSGAYSVSWNTSGAGDGAWHLRAVITDSASNVSDVDLHPGGAGVVVVDNTAPSAAVGAPTAGTYVSGSSVTIAATSGDANPLTYAFLVNGSVIASGSSSSTTWDTTSSSDGPVQLAVRATDPAGNSTTSSPVTVNVDNRAPSPTVNDPGAAISGSPTISVSTDADTASVEFQQRAQGASTWVSIATVTPPFQATLATGTLPDGTYELQAIATDGAGHVGTSPIRTVVVDNTLPSGSIVQPNAGLTIGGPSSQLHATASDASGSGIQSVEFQYTLHGANSWTSIATVTSTPYNAAWDATTVATNDYDLRARITDNAGNVRTTTPMTVHVDSTAPTVVFNDPGVNLAGTAGLTATTAGPDAVSVSFEESPAGANAWHTISTDNASPWTASFDTRTVGDGLYDIRARAVDALGNVGTSTRTNIRVDNTAPSLTAATPADASAVASASSIQLDASEIVTVTGATLDGLATVAPTITGTHIDFATGALADGAHTLALTLNDLAGKTTLVQLHFTVYTPSAGSPPPPVEGNMSQTAPTTITSPDASYSLTMPAGAWPAGANPSSWLVVRLAPTAPASIPAPPAGAAPMEGVVEIVARWADGSGELHQFSAPLDIAFKNVRAGLVPATVDNNAWRLIRHVPTDGQLPSDWQDGYYRSGTVVHVLTRHLTIFGMALDTTPPGAPTGLNGTVNNGNLTLRWSPTQTDGKQIAGFVLFADDQPIKNLGATELEYTVGPFDATDPHAYSIVETDTSGNVSPRSPAIEVVPQLVGLTLADARNALTAKGFGVGDVTVVDSQEPAGTVVGPTDLVTAAAGSALPLQVSAGPGQPATKFVFSVVGTKRLVLTQRRYIGVHLSSTRATTVDATLVNGKGVRIYTWHQSERAGVTIAKLTLPKSLRKPGVYKLLWTATSGGDVVRTTITVQILATAKSAAAAAKKNPAKDVVLAGTDLPKQLPDQQKQGRQLIATSVDSTFTLTGDPSRNVAVIVVDADQYSLGLVHDLRIVFPSVKLVVLTSDPNKLAGAVAAGATIALPKGTPTAKLAKVVASLSGPPPTPRRHS